MGMFDMLSGESAAGAKRCKSSWETDNEESSEKNSNHIRMCGREKDVPPEEEEKKRNGESPTRWTKTSVKF